MQYMSTTDARAAFSGVIDAAQIEPVVIQRQNRDVAVVISPLEYEKLRRLNIWEVEDICIRATAYAKAHGLTEDKLAELLADED